MIFKLEVSVEDGDEKDFYGVWEFEADRPSRRTKLKWLNEIADELINRIMAEEMEELDEGRRTDI